jgi:hypothetical protein
MFALALIAIAVFAAARDGNPGVAQAQSPPPFDLFEQRDRWYSDCCGSGPDVFPLDRTYVTAGATVEAGESAPCIPLGSTIGSTVWIEYIADRNGRLFIDLTGTDFDASVVVYSPESATSFLPSPPGGNLHSVACNLSQGDGDSMSLEIRRGTAYWIQIGGVNGAVGNARIRATCECRPPNDDFSEYAPSLYVNPYEPETTRTVSTALGTTQPGEIQPCANVGATVWYAIFAETPGDIVLDTAGSTFDTVLAIYQVRPDFAGWPPTLADLQLVACEDDGAGPAAITLDNDLYQQYYVQVGGANGASGNLTVTARCEPTCPPFNDNAGQAEWWEPPADMCCITTAGATLEEDEPQPCGAIGATVWYRVTVRGDTTLVIDSGQSDFDTVLAVYEPAAFSPPGAADVLECDASSSSERARVEFRADANVSYLLQAGGRGAATGQLGFRIDCDPSPCPPPNDSIVNPWWFDKPYGQPYEEVHDLRGATVEDGEPLDCGDMGHTAWWVIDMNAGRPSIPFMFDTANSTMPTAIAVYEAPMTYSPDGSLGASFDALRRVACDSGDGGSRAVSRFTASARPEGTRYYVQIGGRDGASGELHLTISCDGGCPPDHDNLAAAYYAPVGYEQFTDTRAATMEPDESRPCGNIGKTIWYRLDGAAPGDYGIRTNGSDYPTVIAVYRNDGFSPPGGLVSLGCSVAGAMTISVEPGFAYYIQIGGVDGSGGGLMARVDCISGCEVTSPPGGAIPGAGGVSGPDTGSGGYLPGARR